MSYSRSGRREATRREERGRSRDRRSRTQDSRDRDEQSHLKRATSRDKNTLGRNRSKSPVQREFRSGADKQYYILKLSSCMQGANREIILDRLKWKNAITDSVNSRLRIIFKMDISFDYTPGDRTELLYGLKELLATQRLYKVETFGYDDFLQAGEEASKFTKMNWFELFTVGNMDFSKANFCFSAFTSDNFKIALARVAKMPFHSWELGRQTNVSQLIKDLIAAWDVEKVSSLVLDDRGDDSLIPSLAKALIEQGKQHLRDRVLLKSFKIGAEKLKNEIQQALQQASSSSASNSFMSVENMSSSSASHAGQPPQNSAATLFLNDLSQRERIQSLEGQLQAQQAELASLREYTAQLPNAQDSLSKAIAELERLKGYESAYNAAITESANLKVELAHTKALLESKERIEALQQDKILSLKKQIYHQIYKEKARSTADLLLAANSPPTPQASMTMTRTSSSFFSPNAEPPVGVNRASSLPSQRMGSR